MKKGTNTTEYVKAIKQMVKLKGLDATNVANHMALEKGLINLDMFQAGARALVAIKMKEE